MQRRTLENRTLKNWEMAVSETPHSLQNWVLQWVMLSVSLEHAEPIISVTHVIDLPSLIPYSMLSLGICGFHHMIIELLVFCSDKGILFRHNLVGPNVF